MLPNLSDRWGATLQVLLPAASESSRVSAGRNALVELKKIDSIRVWVSGKGSKARFAVEVIMESSTTSGCLGLSTASTEPTVRIERELSEFTDVGNTLHGLVDSAHRGERCQLCSAILNWFVFGENPDGFLLAFASKERVSRKLQKFLDDLLAVTIQHTSTEPQGCSARTLIPRAVHEFLFGPPAA